MVESIDVQVERISKKLRSLNGKIPEAALQELYYGGQDIARDATTSIQQGSPSGRIYMRGKNKNIRHIASAAGEPPASDTGALAVSIRAEQTKTGADVKAGGIFVKNKKVDYPVHLEFGTSKMLPRPFMQPAFEKNKKDILRNVENELNKVIKQHGK